jgi:glycerol-3-phosphate dehydrogenase subunit B
LAEGTQYDAIVLGDGIAGFSAALALREKGKRVAVVYRSSGATSVSSGAWDFGPIPREGGSLAALIASTRWKQVFGSLLSGAELPPPLAVWSESFAAATGALTTLPIACRFESPFILPCTSGGLRRVFAAQAQQAAADIAHASGKRIAVVSARRWRFRADFLSRQWNERAQALGLGVEFHATDLPLEGEGGDVPLTRVAADLSSPQQLEIFGEAVARLSDSVDGLLFPPVFPSFAAFETVRAATKFPIAESLASTEPVAGYRLHRAMGEALDRLGVERIAVQQLQVQPAGGRVRELSVVFPGDRGGATLKAEAFVLATGRFFGGGLQSGFARVEETVLALPLHQQADGPRIVERRAVVEGRAEWDRLGVRVDAHYHPLAEDGKPAFQNLVACGSLLGGVDFAAAQIGLGFFATTGRHCVASLT